MSELTWTQFLNICKEAKPTNFSPPDWNNVEDVIATTLNVQKDTKLHDSLLPLRDKYFKAVKNSQKKHSTGRTEHDNTVILKREELTLSAEPP